MLELIVNKSYTYLNKDKGIKVYRINAYVCNRFLFK